MSTLILQAETLKYVATITFIFCLTVFYFIAKKVKKAVPVFVFFASALTATYLVWRTFFTLPFSYGIFGVFLGILLLSAEYMGFFQSLVFRILLTRPQVKIPIQKFKIKPTVNIFVATYNEPIVIIKKTLIACLNLNYPKDKITVYLCDDGKRKEAEVLCKELEVTYITRKDNTHAKAGNVNNALQNTNGEFILLLDADMIPHPDFLEKTIGYFVDPKVGFIQTPQVFYNADPFQHNLKFYNKIPDEQDLFMQDIENGRAYYNAVLHVGTNAVFRRSAIEAIGGIPTGTITEDMATGMLIQAKGYKTLFINEILCTGLSVETFADSIVQRERWCRGNIQVAKKWNPLTVSGLSLAQRIIYTDGLIYWFFGVQKMIYILLPIIYLLFGYAALQTSIANLVLFFVPQFIASIFTFKLLVPKHRSLFWSHMYETAMAPYIALAALIEVIFARPLPFKVTPKGQTSDKTQFALRAALPQIALLLIALFGLSLGMYNIKTYLIIGINSLLINSAWTLYNIIGIFFSILVCIERPRIRYSERIKINEKIQTHIKGVSCRMTDVSETGAKLDCLISQNSETFPENLIMDSKSFGHQQTKIIRKNKNGKKGEIGIKFNQQNTNEYKKIIKHISTKNKGYQDN